MSTCVRSPATLSHSCFLIFSTFFYLPPMCFHRLAGLACFCDDKGEYGEARCSREGDKKCIGGRKRAAHAEILKVKQNKTMLIYSLYLCCGFYEYYISGCFFLVGG